MDDMKTAAKERPGRYVSAIEFQTKRSIRGGYHWRILFEFSLTDGKSYMTSRHGRVKTREDARRTMFQIAHGLGVEEADLALLSEDRGIPISADIDFDLVEGLMDEDAAKESNHSYEPPSEPERGFEATPEYANHLEKVWGEKIRRAEGQAPSSSPRSHAH